MNISVSTLQQIAHAVGKSVATVSRALRNDPRISQATKELIWQKAQELDYTPNQLALSLFNRRMNAVGVIVPRIINYLYGTAIGGIEETMEAAGYNIIICQSNESQKREVSLVNELLANRVAGFMVSLASETADFEHFRRIQRKSVPLILFNRECQEIQTTKIIIDNFQAAYDAVEHLVSVGCQRIAYLGGPASVQISNRREEGYRHCLEQHGMKVEESLIQYTEFDTTSAMNAARNLLYRSQPPDAILAFSDQVAICAMRVCKEKGIRMPQDVCIVGFNNEPVDELIEPSLTSIEQSGYGMGKKAAELLLAQLNATQELPQETHILRSRLIIRESTNRNRIV